MLQTERKYLQMTTFGRDFLFRKCQNSQSSTGGKKTIQADRNMDIQFHRRSCGWVRNI